MPISADSLSRLHTAEAIGTIVEVMRTSHKPEARLKAAETLLDRGHGRAVQAVISVPARHAVALKLAAMSDDELMLIAKSGGGSTPEKGSPHGPGSYAGTIPAPRARGGFLGPLMNSSQELMRVAEGEFKEYPDDEDPCS
jgi:hypothetical protein